MKYLLLLLFPLTLFSMTVEEIDTRISEIDARQLIIPDEIAPIQTLIDTYQSELDAINADLLIASTEVENKETQIADKQIEIGIKVEERDALEEEDPARVPIQDEINILIGERDVLTDELSPLLAAEALKIDEEIAKSIELNEQLALKKMLTDEDAYLTTEKIDLLDTKRRILWQARFDALPDLRMAMEEAGLQQPNAKVFVRDILDSGDETKLLQLEATTAAVQAILDAEIARLQKLEDAKAELRAVDPLTIKTSDTIKMLTDITIILQEMLVR